MDIDEFTGCCGAQIISEFDDLDDGDEEGEPYGHTKKDMIQEFRDIISGAPSGKLLVAILIDQQLKQGWLSVLHKAGFRRVARWTNTGHGNVCNLFVMYKGDTVSPRYAGKKRP